MSATHFGKFFWSDHLSDPCLRACSAAARGVWTDMLCLMAEADGFLTVNDRPLDAGGLARQTGDPKEVVEAALAELEANGVFSRDRRGVIYSRRMIRDRKKVEIARQNGRKGGNPSLRKQSEIPRSDIPRHKQEPGIIQIPDTRMPEAYVRISGSENEAARTREAADDDRCRSVVDLDDLDGRCRSAAGLEQAADAGLLSLAPILALISAGYDVDRDILPALRDMRHRGRFGRSWQYYVPVIREFADKRRENARSAPKPKKKPDEFTEVEWQQKLMVARARKLWVRASWGPAPNESGCLVPIHLLQPGERNMNWPEPLH